MVHILEQRLASEIVPEKSEREREQAHYYRNYVDAPYREKHEKQRKIQRKRNVLLVRLVAERVFEKTAHADILDHKINPCAERDYRKGERRVKVGICGTQERHEFFENARFALGRPKPFGDVFRRVGGRHVGCYLLFAD